MTSSSTNQGGGASGKPDRATHEQSQQAVSAVPVGIPSAVERIAAGLFLAEHPNAEWHGGRARSIWFSRAYAALEAMREPSSAMNCAGEEFLSWAHRPSARDIFEAMIDAALAWPTAEDVAQAIEARRAETGTGSVHESAVPQGCAQTPPESPQP